MSFLANLINKTKQKTEKEFGKNKWRRKAEVEKEREEEENKKTEEVENKKKRAREEEEKSYGPKVKPKAKRAKQEEEDELTPTKRAQELLSKLSEEEIFSRLRKMRQPIRFFGETPEARVKRLRQLEIMEAERKAGASGGRLNDFKDIIGKEVDAEIEAALAKSMGTTDGKESEDLLKQDEIKKNARKSKYDKPRHKSEFEKKEDYILFYWKRILREWEKRLHDRSEGEKIGKDGKNETMRQKQARRDIKPLFKLLKNRQAPRDVVRLVTAMIDALYDRKYDHAQEKYLELSIGNAAWPMGVTMCGIHERAGDSRIHSSQIAHVLNDESQRKYIQAMKRLMTVAERMYPSYTVEQLEEMRMQKAADEVKDRDRKNRELVSGLAG